MRRFLPKSIAGQTIIVLLIGLTVSHVFSMAIYTADRSEVLTTAGQRHIVHRIAAITRLLEETPPEWRGRIINATDSPTLGVTVTPESRILVVEDGIATTNILRTLLAQLVKAPNKDRVAVQIINVEDGDSESPMGGEHWDHSMMARLFHDQSSDLFLRASIQLKDGHWVNFATAVPDGGSIWSTQAVLSMLLMAAGVILFSLWIIRRVTHPLKLFAAASDRLGKDVHAPPMEVTGSVELEQAALAFNGMQDRLRRLIKNRTLLLAAISHDLRTPITLLRLRAEFIGDEEGKSKILTILDDMEAMISSTLRFARDESENEPPVLVELDALIGSICDDMSDSGLPVSFHAREAFTFECKPIAIKRALTNVIENAVKYGSKASIELKKTASGVEIVIVDDGPGIPENDLEQVFLPFYRVEESRSRETGGTGLGLSIARSIIDNHGGEILLSNREIGGLKVRIVLPL